MRPANPKDRAYDFGAVARRLMHEEDAILPDPRDLLNQFLGQVQVVSAFEEFSRTVRISKLAYIKESKKYKGLRGMKTPHGAELLGTWEEFCQLIGRSVDQVDRDIANLRAFGEQALEHLQNAGIGYRELGRLHKLPDDSRQAVIEAAESGDKDKMLSLVEDLVERQQREKKRLESEKKALEEGCAQLDQQLQQKEAQLKTAQEQNRRVFERHSTVPLAVEELQDECMAAVKRAQLFLGTLAQQARAAQDMGGDWGTGCRRHVFASMQQLAVETGMLLAEWSEIFGIAVDDVAFEPMAQIERGRAAQVQEMYDALTGSHENQAHNRKVQRAAAREKSTGKKALGAPMKPREVLPADN